jgi:hypothetical protein
LILEKEKDDQRQGRYVQIVFPRLKGDPHVRIAQGWLPCQASPRMLGKIELLERLGGLDHIQGKRTWRDRMRHGPEGRRHDNYRYIDLGGLQRTLRRARENANDAYHSL